MAIGYAYNLSLQDGWDCNLSLQGDYICNLSLEDSWVCYLQVHKKVTARTINMTTVTLK